MDASLRDVTRALGEWLDAGRPAVLATVVSTDGSAPRGLGARLAIVGEQEWIGALSGGCTETAVLAEAMRLLAAGEPDHAVLVAYAKETLVDVGPVCGATLGVLVEHVDDVLVGSLERLVDVTAAGDAAWLRVDYAPSEAASFTAGDAPLAAGMRVAFERTAVELESCDPATDEAHHAHVVTFDRAADGVVRLQEHVPPGLHLVLGGAGDIARELVELAQRLAWRTTVVDARPTVLAQLTRMCQPDRVVAGWSDAVWDELGVDADTACVALAHESHHDEPFLARALQSDASYVGAVGSRRVQAARRDALDAAGIEPALIDRLRGPAGLDLGGSAAAEVALAIAAEITAVTHERSGGSLTGTDGPIRAR